MSQPVKLSDALVLHARLAGEAQERSIAGQVEFWAGLGRSVELLLEGRQVMALRRDAGSEPLSKALLSVETSEGRLRLQNVLSNRPFPHFEQYTGHPGLLVRIDENGSRTIGRFVNREFVTVEPRQEAGSSLRPKISTRVVNSAAQQKHSGLRKAKRVQASRHERKRSAG